MNKSNYRKNLGKQIKARRDAKGISGSQLGAMIGKPQTRIPEIERGDVKNLDTYFDCIAALGGKFEIKWKK